IKWRVGRSEGGKPKAGTDFAGKQAGKSGSKGSDKKPAKGGRHASARKEPPAPPPQDLIDKMSVKTIAPGVVYKFYHGALNINLIDVNMAKAAVQVRPLLAGDNFCHLADVKNHARQCQALAAVNANYFKQDGTPLGTLIIDK